MNIRIFSNFLIMTLLSGTYYYDSVICEELPYELPVQLFGFPGIILITRFTNFLKKFAYAASPATYRSRNRRDLPFSAIDPEAFDLQDVEKYIVSEFGEKACVFERVCARYAVLASSHPRENMNWAEVLHQYRKSPDQMKEFYLLSVFLGDIVGSSQLCHQLGKRRGCGNIKVEGSS